jgi:hypothetical protein
MSMNNYAVDFDYILQIRKRSGISLLLWLFSLRLIRRRHARLDQVREAA